MFSRFLLWMGAAVITTGVSVALIAGAGVAAADTGGPSDAGGATSSESTNSTAGKPDSKDADESPDSEPDNDAADDEPAEEPSTDEEPADDDPSDAVEPNDEDPPAEDPRAEQPAEDPPAEEPSNERETGESDTAEELTDQRDKPVAVANTPDDELVADKEPAQVLAEPVAASVESTPSAIETTAQSAAVDETESAQLSETLTTAKFEMAPSAAAPAGPTLINVIGTLFFSVFDFFAKLFEGPPVVPPGSTVRVGRSTLEIDCGDGYTVDADWYFPTAGPNPPTRIIYFQHGAFATAGMYNYTAAELAERNNAIVVAPSITSNFFQCDGCMEGGDPMHAAVAKLFGGDRAALLASARLAGYQGSALPQRFVLAGHSGGGQLAGGAVGYFAQLYPSQVANLAGVLLLDTSSIGGAIARGVAKLPITTPVYHVAGTPGPLDSYGVVNDELTAARPNQFVGVQLVGGTHSDAWQSSNSFAGLLVGLVTGFPAPQNIEAVQVLAASWINDWYEGTNTGIYGAPKALIDIPGTTAEAYVLPAPAPQLSLIDLFLKALLESTASLQQFTTCAEDPSATSAQQAACSV